MFYHKDHVLVFSCTHIPFEHPKYLDFLIDIRDRVKCGTVVCCGDLVDNASLSMNHDSDPNGRSPIDEITEARQHLQKYFSAFPSLKVCLGNHDRRISLKAKHVGLPEIAFRPFRQIWDLPSKWQDDFSWEIDGVLYTHGTGLSGDSAPEKASIMHRQSTVIGHIHHNLKSGYMTSQRDRILYMGVGCGIDIKRYAFEYGRDFVKRPVLGCGIVRGGEECQVFAMEL